MNIIVISCGSTSFKYKYFTIIGSVIEEKFSGFVENIGTKETVLRKIYNGKESKIKKSFRNINEAAFYSINNLIDLLIQLNYIKNIKSIDYFAYRFAHGGDEYYDTLIVNNKNIHNLEKYNSFAPTHNKNIINITKYLIEKFPEIKNIYCFETNFFKDLKKFKKIYALPYEWVEKYEIFKYGFHSTAHQYSYLKAKECIKKNNFKMISCHLGGGTSVAAIKNGRSFEISGGFTPQTGTVMVTRPGDFDPYIIIYLLKNKIYSIKELEEQLNDNSGLKGISGISSNVIEIIKEAQSGNKKAELAISVFCYSVLKYIITYIGLLKGVDVITFSGGIGENSAIIRENICKNLDYFKIYINRKANNNNEFVISDTKSKTKLLIINTNEEYMVLKNIFKI